MSIETGKINQRDSAGLKQGVHRILYKNSKLFWESTFIDGISNGLWRVCLRNGKVHSEGNYMNGEQEGEQVYYQY